MNFQRALKQQLQLLNYSSANGSPTVGGTGQPDAGKAEKKQNVMQEAAFLPLHQDRNFFLPLLLNEDFPSLAARALCSVGEDQGAPLTLSPDPRFAKEYGGIQIRRTGGERKGNSNFVLKTTVLTYALPLATLMDYSRISLSL